MSSKKPRSQTRLNQHEQQIDLLRGEIVRTADRTAQRAAKRYLRWATTIDDGSYPPDPGSQSQTPHVLPIVFDDATFTESPGPQSASLTQLDDQRQQYALCLQWHPPGTDVRVHHQNRRWFEIGGGNSSTPLQKILFAFAQLSTKVDCDDPATVHNLDYRPWGIFQLPWTQVDQTGMTWEEGDDVDWEEGDPVNWEDNAGTLTVDNPLRLCGDVNDLVKLEYQGDDLQPLLAEVIHSCYDVREVDYDPVTCTLGYRTYQVCSPARSVASPGDPLVPIIDFDVQTFVTDVGYDPAQCSIYNVYEDFCVIPTGGGPMLLHWLDFRDLQDPCCPCPPCPTSCSGCNSAYLVTINSWSTPDCGCMNVVQVALNNAGGNCSWDYSDNNCTQGSLLMTIECVNNRWVLHIDYNTVGENNDVHASDTIDLGHADDCPPTGTFTPDWNFDLASYVCTTVASQVIVE